MFADVVVLDGGPEGDETVAGPVDHANDFGSRVGPGGDGLDGDGLGEVVDPLVLVVVDVLEDFLHFLANLRRRHDEDENAIFFSI